MADALRIRLAALVLLALTLAACAAPEPERPPGRHVECIPRYLWDPTAPVDNTPLCPTCRCE